MIDAELESFADELSDRLRARADRLDVVPDDPSIWNPTGTSLTLTSSVRVERSSTSWIAIVAAACLTLAVIGGSALLRRSATDDTAAVEASALVERVSLERLLAVGAQPGADEMIVWMAPTATDVQISAVAARLDASEDVDDYSYIDRAETFAEFQAFWADSPEVIDSVRAEELPTSFRVTSADRLAVVELVTGLPGVSGSDLANDAVIEPTGGPDREWPAPLFVLPPGDFEPLPQLDSFIDMPGEDDGPWTVVGRRVPGGVESVVAVSVLSDWVPAGVGSGETVFVDGRELVRGVQQWTEQVEGGWLAYTTSADADDVAAVVRATRLVDDEAVVDPALLEDLEILLTGLDAPDGSVVLTMSTPDPAAPDDVRATPLDLVSILTIPWPSGPSDLVVWGAFGSSMEMTTVRGRQGYFIRPGTHEYATPWSSLAWTEASGHMVMITLDDATDDELIAYAESLRVVDEDTWQAELKPN